MSKQFVEIYTSPNAFSSFTSKGTMNMQEYLRIC